EVRFRDAGLVRGLIVSSLKHALADAGHRASTTVASETLAALRPDAYAWRPPSPNRSMFEAAQDFHAPVSARLEEPLPQAAGTPLGAARAQLHDTYIVAQTADGIVIVDQHAAHERLVYEKMKRAMEDGGIARQPLLIPEVVDLDPSEVERVA